MKNLITFSKYFNESFTHYTIDVKITIHIKMYFYVGKSSFFYVKKGDIIFLLLGWKSGIPWTSYCKTSYLPR